MNYRVVIPSAGLGSRLENLTRHINKSLVSVAHRPTISHAIDQFSDDCEFVIALGYKGDLVREFIEIAYPERSFIFVNVSPYQGPGSGLGYSLLCCQSYLSQPFIFLSCDTLVKEPIPPPNCNWMGYSPQEKVSSYRSLTVCDGHVRTIHEKGDDQAISNNAYIGLAGICDHCAFWAAMHEGGSVAIDQGEAYGIRSLLQATPFLAYEFTWFDTGTLNSLEMARNAFLIPNEPTILDKEHEAIWFVGERVIKFSTDKAFINNRVKRSSHLLGYVPKIMSYSAHMYAYKMAEGDVLSKVVTLPLFRNLLEHCKAFWVSADLDENQKRQFYISCLDFYKEKTRARVDLFFHKTGKLDDTECINGEQMPLMSELLDRVDWEALASGKPGNFHGDFHFENILWNHDTRTFTFLDWRQDFGGHLEIGDIYYDLAKLLHGLILSHEIVARNQYTTTWKTDRICFSFDRRNILVECERLLEKWCAINDYDFSKIRILTALIFINIAALHHYSYALLLYSLGKSILNHELEDQ